MDDQTKALVDNALKNHPNASIQVINVNTPGTVIVIGGNYFANGSKKNKAAQQKEELVEPSVKVSDTNIKEDVAIDSAPPDVRSTSSSSQVEATAVKAVRKIIANKDELVNSFAEKPFDDIVKGISQKGIAQQIIDAADADSIDSILDQHFPDAPF